VAGRRRTRPLRRGTAAWRAYLAGLARGRALARAAEHARRSAAARKAAETRRKRKGKKPERPREKVQELLLYAADVGGAVAWNAWRDWPVAPVRLAAELEEWLEGQLVREGVVTIEPVPWDEEPVPRTLRREVERWHDEGGPRAPEQSPAVTVRRLALQVDILVPEPEPPAREQRGPAA